MTALGGLLAPASVAAQRSEPVQNATDIKEQPEKESFGHEQRLSKEWRHAPDHSEIDSETLPDTENWTAKGTLPAARSMDSDSQLPIAELVGSASASLIEESVKHLFGLMKSVRSNLESNARLDPHAINAACNCAKQMGNLLKLKLDAVKTRKAIR